MQYYAVPVASEILLGEFDLTDQCLRSIHPWVCVKCFATKYSSGMSLDQVKEKIAAKWKQEQRKQPELVLPSLDNCLGAFIVMEDEIQYIIRVRKAIEQRYQQQKDSVDCVVDVCYFNAMMLLRQYFVEILMAPKERLLADPNPQIRSLASQLDTNNCVFDTPGKSSKLAGLKSAKE